ncbi:phosphatidylinositol transfer protein PDR16 [Selaginella moellendorffii]|nr:phosphatidylinositol transfer protein PDR16 [Selaginella moellendorffii]|eukprot:XP_002984166.2 phosphatidylinositol transfer protein PDR16 [Selaginella moellendorffii]
MLKEALSWRASYKPEEIRWGDVARESETGKLYKANYLDKLGRPVLVMRPGAQNTSAPAGQIKQLVYFMENVIVNLPPNGQDQMVWLIDFNGWSIFKSPSVKTAKDIAYILQNFYPEWLGLAVLYNPPYIFETFWVVIKPFLHPSTCKKVKFVYSSNLKLLHDIFDMSKVETAFGGGSSSNFNCHDYGKVMQQDDLRIDSYWGIQRPEIESPDNSSLSTED